MSFDAARGVVYFSAQEAAWVYAMNEEYKRSGFFKRNPTGFNLGLELGRIAQIADETPGEPEAKGYLKAFNPLTGEEVWAVEHITYWNGGVLATAGGLVFQGDAMGNVSAYHPDSGEVLWQSNVYTSILAPPMSYEIDGVQYVAILAGMGGGNNFAGYIDETASVLYGNFGKLLAFKLDGNAELQAPALLDRHIPEQPAITASSADLERGEILYHEVCAACHGLQVKSGGAMPDLRLMASATHQSFNAIVLDGARASVGMASFSDQLSASDAAQVYAYIVTRANEDRAEALTAEGEGTGG
jgi:mono/diheme cytochrome c family protein